MLERVQFHTKVRKASFGSQSSQAPSCDGLHSDYDDVPTFANTVNIPFT